MSSLHAMQGTFASSIAAKILSFKYFISCQRVWQQRELRGFNFFVERLEGSFLGGMMNYPGNKGWWPIYVGIIS